MLCAAAAADEDVDDAIKLFVVIETNPKAQNILSLKFLVLQCIVLPINNIIQGCGSLSKHGFSLSPPSRADRHP